MRHRWLYAQVTTAGQSFQKCNAMHNEANNLFYNLDYNATKLFL